MSLDPEADLREQVELKLARGLGAAETVGPVARADNGQAPPVNR